MFGGGYGVGACGSESAGVLALDGWPPLLPLFPFLVIFIRSAAIEGVSSGGGAEPDLRRGSDC